jgi:rubredoxin|tara:strand:- start:71 stop:373 length:303 start_codon:yes stop_codon:yes gene_type:complete
MGRKNEMKVSKAFTIGLEEAAFIAMESERKGLKVSAFVNKLIRQALLKARGEEVKERKPAGQCHECGERRGYDLVDMEWLCEVCKTEKTEYIKAIVQRQR